MSADYELQNLAKHFDMKGLRPGQKGALNCILDRVGRREKHTAIVLPTRYGKSHVVRLAAFELKARKLIATSIVMVPTQILRAQMADNNDVHDTKQRFSVDPAINSQLFELESHNAAPWLKGNYALTAATIQWSILNKDVLKAWIQSCIRKTGLPPAIFIDESHQTANDNTWGGTVEELVAAGAFVILVTGTPYRADGKIIPGFEVEELSMELSKVTITRRVSDEMKQVLVHPVEKRNIILRPHYNYSYQRAWDEGVICKLNRYTFDVNVSMNGEKLLLSQLVDENKSRELLGELVRHPEGIKEGIKLLMESLDYKRQLFQEPGLSGLIFCGNNGCDEQEGDWHVNRVLSILKNEYPKIRAEIATQDNDQAKQNIEAFKKGRIDVLIVKQMASVGLDIPRLKCILDLSTVRTAASFIQRIMRCATIHSGGLGKIPFGDYIAPCDLAGQALFQKLVSDEGGGQTHRTLLDATSDDLVEVTETEAPIPHIIDIHSMMPGTLSDTDLTSVSAEDMIYARRYRATFSWATNLSDAQAAQAGRAHESGLPLAQLPQQNISPTMSASQVLASKNKIRDTAWRKLWYGYAGAEGVPHDVARNLTKQAVNQMAGYAVWKSWAKENLTEEENDKLIVAIDAVWMHLRAEWAKRPPRAPGTASA